MVQTVRDVRTAQTVPAVTLTPVVPATTNGLVMRRAAGDGAIKLDADDARHVSLFAGIEAADVSTLLEMTHVLECHVGDRVVTQDSVDHELFILLEGTVQVVRDGKLYAVLERGSVFGEIAFLLHLPRTADVVVTSPAARVLVLRDRGLAALLDSESRVAARLMYNLSRILAERLAHTSAH